MVDHPHLRATLAFKLNDMSPFSISGEDLAEETLEQAHAIAIMLGAAFGENEDTSATNGRIVQSAFNGIATLIALSSFASNCVRAVARDLKATTSIDLNPIASSIGCKLTVVMHEPFSDGVFDGARIVAASDRPLPEDLGSTSLPKLGDMLIADIAGAGTRTLELLLVSDRERVS